jgi:hypothetical protein
MPRSEKASAGRVARQEAAIGKGVVTFPRKPRVPLGQTVPEAPAGAAITLSDGGGVIIPNVRLYLVFWGPAWLATTATPSVGQVTDAVDNILIGPYMNSLSQYRGIGSGFLQASIVVSEAVATAPATPPNNFQDSDVQNLLTQVIYAAMLPGPQIDSNLLYIVIFPPGPARAGVAGEHTYFDLNGTNLHYGWVANGGTLASVTSVFSHELVESVTDPEGDAFTLTGTGCPATGWCEIGDVCNGNNAIINGVTVQRYWSNVDQACVVPTDATVKVDKDNKDTPDKNHKDNIDAKRSKDWKDHKNEGKEGKDAAFERAPVAAKPGKEADIGVAGSFQRIAQLSGALGEELAALSDQFGGQEGAGRAFIQPEERPPVGEQALQEPYDPARPY